MCLGTKIKRSQLSLAPLFPKPIIIVSDYFLDFGPLLRATPKGWKKSVGIPDTERYAKSFEKNSLKKSNIPEARLAVTGSFFLTCFDWLKRKDF